MKPENELRQRLAGGPHVDPRSLTYVKEVSFIYNTSLGRVIDALVVNAQEQGLCPDAQQILKENRE